MHFEVLIRVFSHPRYAIFFIMVAFGVSSVAILLPNIDLLWQLGASGSFAVTQLLWFAFGLYTSLGASASLFSGVLVLVLSVLFALDVTLMLYYIRRRQLVLGDRKAHIAGVGGVVSSVLGIGCAACGSVILSGLVGIFGGASLLALLPLHGAEFGLIGVVLLIFTTMYLMHRIDDPLVCPLEL